MALGEGLPDLTGRLRIDTSDLDNATERAHKSAGRLGGAFGVALGGAAALGIAKATGALAGFVTGSVAAARESVKVGKTTEAIIKATGGAAKLTTQQVGDLATRLSSVTGVDDEVIQQSENLLLTFRNVKNEGTGVKAVFDRATSAALDLSKAGFGSVDGAAKMLGKALNDPVKGMSALSRAGVTFTQAQKDQVAALIKNGDALGAQQIILSEVEHQVGGVAAKTATNADRAKVAFGNLQEKLGGAMLPLIDKLSGAFVAFVPTLERTATRVVELVKAFAHSEGVQSFIDGIKELEPVARRVFGFFADHAKPILVGLGIALGVAFAPMTLLTVGLVALYGHSEAFRNVIAKVAGFVTGTVVPALQSFGGYVTDTIVPALQRFGGFLAANVLPVLAMIGGYITANFVPAMRAIGDFITGSLLPAFRQVGDFLVTTFRPTFDALVGVITTRVIPAVVGLAQRISDNRAPLLAIAGFILQVVKVAGVFVVALAAVVAKILGAVLPILVRLAGFLIGTVVDAISKVIGIVGALVRAFQTIWPTIKAAIDIVTTILRGAIGIIRGIVQVIVGIFTGDFGKIKDGVRTILDAVIRLVRDLPGKVLSYLGDLGGLLLHAGEALIQGLIDGIGNKLRALRDKMGQVASTIKGFLPGSPVKEGPLVSWNNGGAGKRLMDMTIEGIASRTPAMQAALSGALQAGSPVALARVGAAATAAAAGGVAGLDTARLEGLLVEVRDAIGASNDRYLTLARQGAVR